MKGHVRLRIAFLLAILVAIGPLAAQTIVAPSSIAPGDPLLCWMRSDRPVLSALASLKDGTGKKLASAGSFFMPSNEDIFLYGFLLPVPLKAAQGQANLTVSTIFDEGIEGQKTIELSADLVIEAKKFMKEDIPLDKANTDLRTKPDPAKTAETKTFAEIFAARDLTALFASGPMIKPLTVTWRETAGFADERRYLYYNGGSDSTYHGGLDLGAKEGSEVLACAAGRVVFAGHRIVTGNTVVIEHLPGLFSIYMHLSSIALREGDIADSGELIGRVGSTGLSTGPHLHWELRIGDISVDPHYWLTRPLLDKDSISGKIKTPAEGR